VSWATPADVRELLFERREHRTNFTGSTISLSRSDATGISKLVKNGSELTEVSGSPGSGEFSFTEPDEITLGDSAVQGDEFDIVPEVYLTDSQIQGAIDDIHDLMLPEIAAYYDTPFNGDPPQLVEIERRATAYSIVVRFDGHPNFLAGEETKESLRELYMEGKEKLQRILDGNTPLLDENDDVIPRLSGATDPRVFFDFERSGHANNQDIH